MFLRAACPALPTRRSGRRCSWCGADGTRGGPDDYRLRWPWAALLIFFFSDPRATPDARLALGAAFLRADRFSFFRSVRSVTVFVFISLFSVLRIFRPVS